MTVRSRIQRSCRMQTHHINFYFFSTCAWSRPRLESKKYETSKHELEDMRKKLNAMSSDNHRLKGSLNQFDGNDKQQRMKIEELNQQMAESCEKLRAANKEKVMREVILNWIIKIAGPLIVWGNYYANCYCRTLNFPSYLITLVEPPSRAGRRETTVPDKEARPSNCNRRARKESRDDQAARENRREAEKGHRLAHVGVDSDERWKARRFVKR